MPVEIFWELHQQRRINEAGTDAATARTKAERIDSEVDFLKRKVEHLCLASQALWELLRDRTNLEEGDILAKMEEIDLRDGKKDGKIGHKPLVCPKCDRTANSSRTKCLYCGEVLVKDHVFE